MYRTVKYNNGQYHELDTFETLDAAIASAKSLHHPDWPVWQGVWVVNPVGRIEFSTRSGYAFETVGGAEK